MKNITGSEFEQLKRYFDQNDTWNGAQYLNQLFQDWVTSYMSECVTNQHSGQWKRYGQPRGLVPHEFHNGNNTVTGFGIDPDILSKLDSLDCVFMTNQQAQDLMAQVVNLREQIEELAKMHTEAADHIPTIISTKGQLKALEQKFAADDKVVIETSYERAMRILK